ncbi:MAG: alpha/beta hydrolase [Planctomycetota bacterium]
MTERTGWSRWLKRRLIAVAVGLAVYFVVMFPLGCGRALADRLLLFGSTRPMAAAGATPATIPSDAGELEVFVATSASAIGRPPERYVLRLMGNASRAEVEATPTAQRWNDVPTEVWALNYPGFGASPGPQSLRKLLPAAEAVWEAMNTQAVDAPCYVDGDSMGTAVALALATKRRGDLPVAGLILKNPPPLRQLIMGRYGWWNLWLAAWPLASSVPSELDSITNAAQCHTPAIFLQATGDSLIPPAYQNQIIDAYAGRAVVIELVDADHNTLPTMEEEQAIRDRIAEHFREP